MSSTYSIETLTRVHEVTALNPVPKNANNGSRAGHIGSTCLKLKCAGEYAMRLAVAVTARRGEGISDARS